MTNIRLRIRRNFGIKKTPVWKLWNYSLKYHKVVWRERIGMIIEVKFMKHI